jgi:aspartyl-tRNA(Asn)/glutamyl-tRNA(Gln) amidotransferase subunit B
VISNNIAKKLIVPLTEKGGSARKMVEDQGMSVISDEGALKDTVKKIIAANQSEVEKYKSGKPQLFGFFVGQIMKETKGRANPETVNKLLREELDG